MNSEYYLWRLVDRYLSMGNLSYSEALESARRDVYEVPNNSESLAALVGQYGLHVVVEKIKLASSLKADHFIKSQIG